MKNKVFLTLKGTYQYAKATHTKFVSNTQKDFREVLRMAKQGMRRVDESEPHGTESNHKMHQSKDPQTQVQEIQGKAKTSSKKAGRIY